MSGKPVGSVVYLYLDVFRDVQVADLVRTPSGRLYRVVDVRRQERGIHRGRWHLHALVLDPSTPLDGESIIDIVWYPR